MTGDVVLIRLRSASRQVSAEWIALRIVAQGGEFVAWMLFAHRLSTADLGRLAVAYLIFRYAGLIADLASNFAGVRSVARDEPAADLSAFVRAREMATGLALGAVVLATALAAWELLPLTLVIVQRGANRDWIALGRGRERRAGLPPMIAIASLLVAALATSTVLAASCTIGVGHALAAAVSIAANPVGKARSSIRAALRRSRAMTAVLLADQIYASSDVLLVGLLMTTSDAGVYSTLYRLPAAWLAGVALVTSGWLRSATERSGSTAGRVQTARRALVAGLGGLTSIIVLAPLVWFGLPVVLGSPFSDERGTAMVLVLAAVLASAAAPMSTAYMSSHPDGDLARVNLTIAALNVGGGLLLIPVIGIVGAAVMTLLAYAGLAVFYTSRLVRTSPSSLQPGQPEARLEPCA